MFAFQFVLVLIMNLFYNSKVGDQLLHKGDTYPNG